MQKYQVGERIKFEMDTSYGTATIPAVIDMYDSHNDWYHVVVEQKRELTYWLRSRDVIPCFERYVKF